MGRLILCNVPCLAFLGAGVYLLMHEHPVAGGWCLAFALLAMHTFDSKPQEPTP